LLDRITTPFGIRAIRFTADNGFLLNGERVQLQGVCNHHDLGALGAAFNVRAAQRQLEIMKEMGVNALRTSHNPPAPELLDLCDRMGILVMDEAFDCWKSGKTRNDYHTLWDDWHEADLRAMIRRDRNHPSVILWSIGNEVPDQWKPEGPSIAADLTQIAHEEDPTRPTTAGCDAVRSAYNGFADGVDVFGFNYKPRDFGRFRTERPGQPVLGSETASTISSRGEYFFPISDRMETGRCNFQVSSYDLNTCNWSNLPDADFAGEHRFPFGAGQFVWTGFDYLGEPSPYANNAPSRSSYFGIVDLAGFNLTVY
jgi:beta-galactosidase